MRWRTRGVLAGGFAGFILGFLGWVFFSPAPRTVHDKMHSLVSGCVCAAVVAVIGGLTRRAVPRSVVVPVIVFALISAVPATPTGKGQLVPVVATIYVHGATIWPGVLAAHLVATALVSVPVLKFGGRQQPPTDAEPPVGAPL